MHVILCGGGTVGHIAPALAIADILKNRIPSLEPHFILRTGGKENRRVEESGYPIHYIDVRGFERRVTLRNLQTLRLTLGAIRSVKEELRRDPPALVIGTGGYVSLPVVYAATSCGIPTVLHESNAVPGLTVRLMARRVDTVLLNLPGCERTLPDKVHTVTVGMPVRSDIQRQSRESARRKLGLKPGHLLIVSFGGSLGAELINRYCLKFMREYSLAVSHVHHIHGCGHRYYDAIREEHPLLCYGGRRCVVKAYLDDLSTLLPAADIVISRSGAATLSEICAAGAASILIPSPNVAGNHQFQNAKRLEEAGACRLLNEKETSYRDFEQTVSTLLHDSTARQSMRCAAHALHDAHTDDKIFQAIKKFIL